MVGKRIHKSGATSGRKGVRAITALAPAFALAFVFTVAAPVGFDSGFAEKSVLAAGKGGGGGHGGGHGKGGGKGAKPIPEEEAAAIEFDSFGLEADGSEVAADTPLLPDDANAGKNQVIRELAGLPEDSALSEEEELEAIRSGWGTWRTADGPETIMSQ